MARNSEGVVRQFDEANKTLNAEFWLLMVILEQCQAGAKDLRPLDGLPLRAVLRAFFPNSRPASVAKIRLRNVSLSRDLIDLTMAIRRWLPSYFLVLSKSIAETFVEEILLQRSRTDKAILAAIDKRRARPRSRQASDPWVPPSRSRVIQQVALEITRGDFAKSRDVIDLRPSVNSGLSDKLKKFARTRNRVAHALGDLKSPQRKRSPASIATWKSAVDCYQRLLDALG